MYLSSFYKLKFEKYVFNAKVFGPFAGAAGLWGTSFLIKRFGSYTHLFTTWSTLISSLLQEVWSAESLKISERMIEYQNNINYQSSFLVANYSLCYQHDFIGEKSNEKGKIEVWGGSFEV